MGVWVVYGGRFCAPEAGIEEDDADDAEEAVQGPDCDARVYEAVPIEE